MTTNTYTVESPNNGLVGASTLVHYSEVVLYWGVLVKKPYICIVYHMDIFYSMFQDMIMIRDKPIVTPATPLWGGPDV